MSDNTPLPVILCGKTEQIGKGVIAGLTPEYEVVQFILTAEAGIIEIPHLLSKTGSAPPSNSSSLGSGNYSSIPVAIILGGGYDTKEVERLRDAVTKTEGARKVPWLRPDLTKPAPPVGPEYGKAMVVRVKEALKRLREEQRLDGEFEDVVWY